MDYTSGRDFITYKLAYWAKCEKQDIVNSVSSVAVAASSKQLIFRMASVTRMVLQVCPASPGYYGATMATTSVMEPMFTLHSSLVLKTVGRTTASMGFWVSNKIAQN